MKNVNFITALSPKKQYAIARWFYLSLALLCVTLSILSFFLAPEFYYLYSLKKDLNSMNAKTTNYEALLKKKEEINKKNEILNKKIAKINEYKQQPNSPYTYITAIIEAATDTIKIESIRIDKKELNLTIVCSSPEKATTFVKKLIDSQQFANLTLLSLQQDPQTKLLRCIIQEKKEKK